MLSFRQCASLIEAALEGEQQEINILRWLIGYEKEMSWNDFSEKLKKANEPEDTRTGQQILNDTGALFAKYGM